MSDRPFVVMLPPRLVGGVAADVVVRVRQDTGRAGIWRPVCLVQHS